MGANLAPSFSSLYVAYFENHYILDPGVNPFYHYILCYHRFIDDVFIIYTGDEETLTAFHAYLNSANQHLKFTLEFNHENISFLDVMVKIDGSTIQTDLFRKPTDRNTILRGDSFHPTHLIKSLPISQYHRARRVCSTDESYQKQASDLNNRFLERRYSQTWIDAANQRYSAITQEEALKPRERTTKEQSPLCFTTYSPIGFELRRILKHHWHVISTDPKMKHLYKEPPKLIFKRAPTLRNQLVRSYTPADRNHTFLDDIPDGNYKCGNCAQCRYTKKTKTYKHPHSGKIMKVRGVISCESTFCIYTICCPCGLTYVGCTTRSLRTRISEHRSNIRCGKIERNPVAAHFQAASHNLCYLQYMGIELVPKPPRGGDHKRLLLQRETYYIHLLNSMSPNGLNLEFDIKPFL